MSSDAREKWIQSVLVPRILESGDFQGAILTKTEVEEMETMKDGWASKMYAINLHLYQEENKIVSFVLKVMSDNKVMREKIPNEEQFFNEIHFYSIVKPFLSSQTSMSLLDSFENLFPRCYYSYYNKDKIPESIEDALIVMENLKVRDFKLGNRSSLDFEHLSLAVQSLGIFHAFSYFMKERDPELFTNIVKPIREAVILRKNETMANAGYTLFQERVIDALAVKRSHNDSQVVRLRELVAQKPFDKVVDLVLPEEPLAVLCHGDFLRNNVLFRYEDGKPVEMKIIDFQTIRYASPAIDLSLILCMNSTHELRVKHFEELLKLYHSSLTDTLAALLGKAKGELDPRYSYEAFLDDFRRHAVYGYLTTIMFLPMMLASNEELSKLMKISWDDLASPEHIEFTRRLGGDNATRAITSLAEDLLERQCL